MFKIEREMRASLGNYTIGDVVIPLPGNKEIRMGSNTAIALDGKVLGQPAAHNLRLTLSPDRNSLKLTGELVRDNPASPPAFALPLEIIEQREVAVGPTEVQLTRALGVPGASSFPSTDTVSLPLLPPDWTTANRQVRVELDDGQTRVVNPTVLPVNSSATVQGRSVVFSAVRIKDQVNLSLTAPNALRPGTGGD